MGSRFAVVGEPAWRDTELAVQIAYEMVELQGWGRSTLLCRRTKGVEGEFWRMWVTRRSLHAEQGDPLAAIKAGQVDYLVAFVHHRGDFAAQCVLAATRACWPPIRGH